MTEGVAVEGVAVGLGRPGHEIVERRAQFSFKTISS